MTRGISFRTHGSGHGTSALTPLEQTGTATSPTAAAPAGAAARSPGAERALAAALHARFTQSSQGTANQLLTDNPLSAALANIKTRLLGEDEENMLLPDDSAHTPVGLSEWHDALEGNMSGATLLPSLFAVPEASLDARDKEVIDDFRRNADANPNNTELTKQYYCQVLAEIAFWLKQQPHQPAIRSLDDLRRHASSTNAKDKRTAKKLAERFAGSDALAAVRRGIQHNRHADIIDALGASAANTPLHLPPSSVSRQTERLLSAYLTIPHLKYIHPSAFRADVVQLKKLANWLEERGVSGQSIALGIDSLEKLLRHHHWDDVQKLIAVFKKETTDWKADRQIKGAVETFWQMWPHMEESLMASLSQEGMQNSGLDGANPFGQQEEASDSEMLESFLHHADANPCNTSLSRIYYSDVLRTRSVSLQ